MALTFKIIPKKPQLIVPSQPTPHELKSLSELDNQESLRMNYPMIMFYKSINPSTKGLMINNLANIIRQALAKTLVYYYPYAGRLVEGQDGKFAVNCTAEGVVFVEAEADIELEQLGDTVGPPCRYPYLLVCDVQGSNGEMIGCPLMLVQVTLFTCGGFALAIRFNHVISDALGSIQFVNTMSEMAKGASTPTILPIWKRELLNPRKPPCVRYAHPEYDVESKHVKIPSSMDDKNLIRKSFPFGPQEIEAIRQNLPPEVRSTSTFVLISACVWISRTRALQFERDDHVLITCMINVRGKNLLDLPLGYYGNGIICPGKVTKVKTLCDSPLGYAIRLVKEARRQATLDYSKSTIDFLATNPRAKLTSPWNFVVSDVSKVGFDEVDFGYGKPIYGGTMYGGTFNNIAYDRYFNREGEEVMLAPMILPNATMERFESELRRLIWGPMEKSDNPMNIVPSKL